MGQASRHARLCAGTALSAFILILAGHAPVKAQTAQPVTDTQIKMLQQQIDALQKTVQQQYSNLVAERVTVGCSLTIRGLERDSKIASVIVSDLVGGRKAEDVGRPVFASKGLVQAAQGWVVGQQDVHITVEAYGSAGAVEEARQTGL